MPQRAFAVQPGGAMSNQSGSAGKTGRVLQGIRNIPAVPGRRHRSPVWALPLREVHAGHGGQDNRRWRDDRTGGVRVTVLEHPGHTVGSLSYAGTFDGNGRDYTVLIANQAIVNPGMRPVVHPTFEGIAEDFASTCRRQKALAIDIRVAAHPGACRLREKYAPGQACSPDTFVDPQGCRAVAERLEQNCLDQVRNERYAERRLSDE